jgi:membrane protease YdiL (CAAX protease family)
VTRDALRGFGPIGILAIVAILAASFAGPPFAAALVLIWAWLSRTPIGLSRPKRWVATIAIGLAFGALFKLLMKAVVMPLFGTPAINPAYHWLAGNTAALPGIAAAVIFGAGFSEEIFYRGYLFERLGKLRVPEAAILIVTSLWFGLVHYTGQGLPGVEQAVITGLVFGGLFLATRTLWLSIAAHAAFDLAAVAIIYFDVETPVAHLVYN